MPKKPKLVEFKMPATPQKSLGTGSKSSGTGTGTGRGRPREKKENIPKKSTGDRSRSSTHVVGGGQKVQEVIYQSIELGKKALIQKVTDYKDILGISLTAMKMNLP